MKYVYPALFIACEEGGYVVEFPDLPGCYTQGNDLYDALYMAESLLNEWLEYLTDKNMEIPKASNLQDIKLDDGQFVSLIRAEAGVPEVAVSA